MKIIEQSVITSLVIVMIIFAMGIIQNALGLSDRTTIEVLYAAVTLAPVAIGMIFYRKEN